MAQRAIKEAAQKYMQLIPKNRYVERLAKTPRHVLVPQFEALHAHLRADQLSRGVASLSVGAESYLAMRAAFSRSLATLSIASWVLGIGDRHLDNFMLEETSARLVGIDFGHAFGSATYQLPVPELMAIRLTRQASHTHTRILRVCHTHTFCPCVTLPSCPFVTRPILPRFDEQMSSFMRPLESSVLLRTHMVHTLRALRQHREELMGLISVFVHEPLVDWEKQSKKLGREQGKGSEGNGTGTAAPTAADGRAATAASNPAGTSVRGAMPTGGSSGGSSGGDELGSGGSGRSESMARSWARGRIEAVSAKLSGANSARLTIEEVRMSTQKAVVEHRTAIEDKVLGPEGSLRRVHGREGLSVEEQVDVLIEQATDPAILGCTWVGWKPWV